MTLLPLDLLGGRNAVGVCQSSPMADQDEGALLVVRSLVDLIEPGATPAPVTGRAECPENPTARPVSSVAETHLGRLPC